MNVDPAILSAAIKSEAGNAADLYLVRLNSLDERLNSVQMIMTDRMNNLQSILSELRVQLGKVIQHLHDMEIVGGGVRCLQQERRLDGIEIWRKNIERWQSKVNGRITLCFLGGLILMAWLGYESKDVIDAFKLIL